MSKKEPKVAIVHDWLVGYAGGDRVVDAMKRVFPNAVIYTLVYDPKNMPEHFNPHELVPEGALLQQAVQGHAAADAPRV